METKQCTRCGEVKELSGFYKGYNKSGYRSWCKSCMCEWDRNKYHSTPQYKYAKNEKIRTSWETDDEAWARRQLTARKSHLKRNYGLSLDDYQNILESQGSCCAICGNHHSKSAHGRLVVDHCHKTGKIRQLLCDLCNTALGKFKDSPELLEKAAAYLRKHSG